MRSENRFERLAGPTMTMEEFTGEIPSVYLRLEEYRKILTGCESLAVARKEFMRIFKEARNGE